MLNGKYINVRIENQYTNWPIIKSCLIASFGVNTVLEKAPWTRFVRLARPLTAGNSYISSVVIRYCNYSTRIAPPGKSVIQISFDIDSDWWLENR